MALGVMVTVGHQNRRTGTGRESDPDLRACLDSRRDSGTARPRPPRHARDLKGRSRSGARGCQPSSE